jgi:hypothetical protein
MRIKKVLPFLLIPLLISNILFAQNSPEDLSGKFFDLYKSDSSDKAIDYIFSTNKYAKDSQESIDDLKRSLRKASDVAGPFWGYELLSKKTAGQNLTMLTFLVKHERDPLTFRFLFYKPHDKWQVQDFKFDNKIDDELEEASKAYRFKENYD